MTVARTHDVDMRVAMISMHTSPLDQPGSGDAGGMNVYVARTAQLVAQAGATVDVFTRATSSRQPESVAMGPGVTVHNLPAGPFAGLRKEELPEQVCPFTSEVLRFALAKSDSPYDVVHSHYWLSGQAGWLTSQRWRVPLVHSMHTMAKVKNDNLAVGDRPEPLVRVVGEEQVVRAADRLIANTADERFELMRHYGAPGERVDVVHPGVDLATFSPRDRDTARRRTGFSADRDIVVFVGRIQPLKAPDLLVRAVADLVAREPHRRERLQLVVCGGPSGAGVAHPEELLQLAGHLGVADLITFLPPLAPTALADLYASADVVAVPSYSESFGLVALEAQACGVPVLAACVGGLRTAVSHRSSGVLVDGHEPYTWSKELADLLDRPRERSRLAAGARRHAQDFSWAATAAGTLAAYSEARAGRRVLQPIT